ncbi:hypothetical protein [Aeromicrobium sp.]|uniref:hypothetical protein n=1 Tax=Aeromicrobium sp. TaxID=1871063 RepID=UPI0030BF5B39
MPAADSVRQWIELFVRIRGGESAERSFVGRRPCRDDECDLDAHYRLMGRRSGAQWDWAIGTYEDLAIQRGRGARR